MMPLAIAVAVVVVATIALVGWRWWLDASLTKHERVAKWDEERLQEAIAKTTALERRVKDLEYAVKR